MKIRVNISTGAWNSKKKFKSKCSRWWHGRPRNNHRGSSCSRCQGNTATQQTQCPTGRKPLPGGDLRSFHWQSLKLKGQGRWLTRKNSKHIAWLGMWWTFASVSDLCWSAVGTWHGGESDGPLSATINLPVRLDLAWRVSATCKKKKKIMRWTG